MAATSVAIKTPRRLSAFDMGWENQTVKAATTIYHGTWVGFDNTGAVVNADSAQIVVGRARCPNGISAAAGEKVSIDQGIFRWQKGALTIAAIGTIVYADDNQTASASALAGPPGGICVDVDADGAWVLSGMGVGTLEIGS